MENLYSSSKSNLIQQFFLNSLPNDLNIHFTPSEVHLQEKQV